VVAGIKKRAGCARSALSELPPHKRGSRRLPSRAGVNTPRRRTITQNTCKNTPKTAPTLPQTHTNPHNRNAHNQLNTTRTSQHHNTPPFFGTSALHILRPHHPLFIPPLNSKGARRCAPTPHAPQHIPKTPSHPTPTASPTHTTCPPAPRTIPTPHQRPIHPRTPRHAPLPAVKTPTRLLPQPKTALHPTKPHLHLPTLPQLQHQHLQRHRQLPPTLPIGYRVYPTGSLSRRPHACTGTIRHPVRSAHIGCGVHCPVAIHTRTPPPRCVVLWQVAPAQVLARAHAADRVRQLQLAQRLGITPPVAHAQQPLLGAPCRVEPRAHPLQAGNPALDFGTARGGVGIAGRWGRRWAASRRAHSERWGRLQASLPSRSVGLGAVRARTGRGRG
jgi:hypothetical protein